MFWYQFLQIEEKGCGLAYLMHIVTLLRITFHSRELWNRYLHPWRESFQWKPCWPQWCVQDWIEAPPDHYLCTVWSEALLAFDSLSRHYNHHWQTNRKGWWTQGLIPHNFGLRWHYAVSIQNQTNQSWGPMQELTCCTLWGFHRWLCVGCRIGSPGQCVSPLSDRRLPPCHSHRSAPLAETPEETLHVSQRIWNKKKLENEGSCKWFKKGEAYLDYITVVIPPKNRIQLFGDVIFSVFDFILAKSKNNVRVRFPIWVSRVQVGSLQKENAECSSLTCFCLYLKVWILSSTK